MLPPGLSMLWEDTDPDRALADRFGLAGLAAAEAWLRGVLRDAWGLAVEGCERVVVSDTNALAWVQVGHGVVVVVKVGAHAPAFPRLAALARLVGDLGEQGLPVGAPLPAGDGSRRVVVETNRPLSVAVLPLVPGEPLDVADLEAVRATGSVAGRLHRALAQVPVTELLGEPHRGSQVPVRDRLAAVLERPSPSVAEPARARLRSLLEALDDPDRPRQLVHGDVRAANVLVERGQVSALLDFDEVHLDHRAVDLGRAAALLATRFRDWGPAPADARAALLAAYRSEAPLTAVEAGWVEAAMLSTTLSMVPAGADPTGWATEAGRMGRSPSA